MEINKFRAYRPIKKMPRTCSRSGEFATVVGYTTGYGIPMGMMKDSTFRLIRNPHILPTGYNHAHLMPEVYGQLFDNEEIRDQYILEHGYSVAYYNRPSCWYGLRLPKATKKYIAKTGNVEIIPAILNRLDKCSDYEWTNGAEPIHHGKRHNKG